MLDHRRRVNGFRRFRSGSGRMKGPYQILLYLWMFVLSILLIIITVMGVTRNISAHTTQRTPVHACNGSQAEPSLFRPFYLHYIWFDESNQSTPLGFPDYLSVLSGVHRLKPDGVLVHGDREPTGDCWKILKEQNLAAFLPINKTISIGISEHGPIPLSHQHHSTDIAKLDVLLRFGGIVVDFDVYFIRGEKVKRILEQGRAITCYGDFIGYSMGLIAAPPSSKFLWAWRRSYSDIYSLDWDFNSDLVPKFLSHLYPAETYVLNSTCNNPMPKQLADFYGGLGVVNWKDSVAVKTYAKEQEMFLNSPTDLQTGNLTDYKELLLTIMENRQLPPEMAVLEHEIILSSNLEP